MSNKIRVSQSGSGAPTEVTPIFKGQIYIDEDTGDLYRAYGTSSGNWYIFGNINNLTEKTTPVDADLVTLSDSAASHSLKKLTWANIKSVLNTYLATIFAPIAKGVTNGDSHDHSGGDGAQIDHTSLSNIGTNTHAQIDTLLTKLMTWNSISSSVTASVNNAYVITGGTTTITLPATCAVGDKVIITNQANSDPTTAKVVPASGDTINNVLSDYSNVDSTGYIGLIRYASIELTCVVANTTWVISGGGGTYSTKPTSTSTSVSSDVTRGAGYNIVKALYTTSDTTLDSSNTSTAGITVVNANKASLLVLTLSGSDTFAGQIIKIVGIGAGGWKIAQNGAYSKIYFGGSSTTTGATGYIASTKQYDSVELYCMDCDGASSVWTVISSVGNITIV